MTEETGVNWKIAEYLARTERIAANAARYIARDDDCTDWCLYARRYVEEELFSGPRLLDSRTVRAAAGILLDRGDAEGAAAFKRVADTDWELEAAAPEWVGRYAGRPLTASERASDRLMGSGTVRPETWEITRGTDGAEYRPVRITGPGKRGRPAVTVFADTRVVDVVTGFATARERDRWLRGRTGGAAGAWPSPWPERRAWPVPSCASGPLFRAVREERVLAWLLSGAVPDRGTACALEATSFTTHSRAEIYRAWSTTASRSPGGAPDTHDVREELIKRVLRAPAEAADSVGWPYGQKATGYLERLLVTPVTSTDARAAARELAAEDAEAAEYARAHPPEPVQRPEWKCRIRLIPPPSPPAMRYTESPGGPEPGPRM